MENNQSFEFTYCAKRQQEIEAIRQKYLPKEEDKMEQLRRLHSIPSQKAQAASIAMGVLGTLILGTGMSLCMTELGAVFGDPAMVIGILAGVLGLALVAMAYPIYNTVLRKERQRIAPEILRLSDELLT